MSPQPIPMDPKIILDIIIKRRWFIIVPFCLSLIVGIFLAITLPKTYGAETLIMIEPQTVPTNFVRSIVSTDISSRISTISQQILSRTNLEKVINDYKLFTGEKYKNTYLEDKLESLRKRITVDVNSRRSGADAFRISFRDASPEKVMRVTNALASYFINENLKVRETQAIGTSSFLDAELNTMRDRLEEREDTLREYKKTHMGGLPEQLQTNLRILESLQTQKYEKQTIIRGIEENIYTLKNTSNSFDTLAGGLSMDDLMVDIGDSDGGQASEELTQLRGLLDQLKTRYTDNHPDVLQIKRRISELETKMQTEAADTEVDAALPVESAMPTIDFQDVQLAELKSSFKRHQVELDEINDQLAIYKKRIEDTPRREQELLTIERDYNNLKSLYESLLNRKLESEIAVNMERRQKGEQFRILDSAKLPEKPISPNLQKIFILFIGVGVALGGGLVFLLEYLDNSYKQPEEIEKELDLNVLCTIPQIADGKQKRLELIEKTAFFAVITVSAMLFAIFTLLTQKGVDQFLAMVKSIVT